MHNNNKQIDRIIKNEHENEMNINNVYNIFGDRISTEISVNSFIIRLNLRQFIQKTHN